MAHADPEKLRVAQQLRRRYPPLRDARGGPDHVARTGTSELISPITEQALAAGARDPEHLALLRQLELRSFIGVPLWARGAALGCLTLVSGRPGTSYDAVDLRFAEELARRVATAIDNARMYKRTQDAVRLREDFLSVASHELRTPLTPLQLQLQNPLSPAA